MVDETSDRRLTAFARLRGGLHDLGLTLKSPRVQATLTLLYERCGLEPKPHFYDLPTDLIEKFAQRIEQELIRELTNTASSDPVCLSGRATSPPATPNH